MDGIVWLQLILSQEYNGIIDETDKQIEAAYTRRFKKKTKKSIKGASIGGVKEERKNIPDSILQLINRRTKLKEEVGVKFEGIADVKENLFV